MDEHTNTDKNIATRQCGSLCRTVKHHCNMSVNGRLKAILLLALYLMKTQNKLVSILSFSRSNLEWQTNQNDQ